MMYCQLISENQVAEERLRKQVEKWVENIQQLFQIVTQNYIILNNMVEGKKESTKKINVLRICRLLLQTCQYNPVNLIQSYLAPTIFSIATKCFEGQINYQVVYENKFCGLKQREWVMGGQIIALGSQIKPFQIHEGYELCEYSQYYKYGEEIRKHLFPSQVKTNLNYRNKFLSNIKIFHHNYHSYQQFFLQQTQCFLKNNKNNSPLNLLSHLKINRDYLNADIIGLCVQIMENGFNIDHQIKALFLLGQLVLWGDIQVILMINYSDVMVNICKRVEQEILLGRQRSWKSRKYEKQILWHVELWSTLMPYENMIQESENESLIFGIYEDMVKKKIEFPQNNLKEKLNKEFKENMKVNSEKNKRILEELYFQKCRLEESEFMESSPSVLRSDNIQYLKLKEKMRCVNSLLNLQTLSQSNLPQIVYQIKLYENEIQKIVQAISNLPENIKKDEIELEGEEFLLKITTFINTYSRFLNKNMSYDDFIFIVRSKVLPFDHHHLRHYLEQSCSGTSKYFFDSSSDESIHSIKSLIHLRYSKKQGQTASKEVKSEEGRKEELIQSYQINVNQKNQNKNVSFKDCSQISSALIKVSERQAKLTQNLTNKKSFMHSPPKYKRSKSKLKNNDKNILHPDQHPKRSFRKHSQQQIKPDSQIQIGKGDFIKMNDINQQFIHEYEQKTLKKLLKDKIRVLKTSSIEIGSKSQRQGSSLVITYFVTPLLPICKFDCICSTTPQLQIIVYPFQQNCLMVHQQYKIYIQVQMMDYAFPLPRIKFIYSWKENNEEKGPEIYESLLPVLLIKFIENRQIKTNELEREFCIVSSKRSRQIRINRSILREDKSIHKYIKNLILLHEIPNKQTVYGTYCIYKKIHFIIKIIIQHQQIMWIEGITFPPNDDHLLHYYIYLLTQLFSSPQL